MPSKANKPYPSLNNVSALYNVKKGSKDVVTEESPKQVLPISAIQLNPLQPRRYFAPEKLAQLADSIKEHGILEPLLVRPLTDGKYELIAGERRLKAAQLVGLTEAPVVSREFNDREALQVALMENLQREDLNPVEETEGVLALLSISLDLPKSEVTSLLHRVNHAKNRDLQLEDNVILQLEKVESILAVVGKFTAESFRVNRLPLLNLPEDVLEVLRQGKLEYTKARAIARLKDDKQRKSLLKDAITKNLSLSQIKERIAALKAADEEEKPVTIRQQFDSAYQQMKNSKVWDDPKKQRKLEKLLADLQALIEA